MRSLDQLEAAPIPGTEGGVNPFFSPDGRFVGYWSTGEIRRVPVAGGPPVRVSETRPIFGASWGDDDRIVFSRATGGLLEVPAAGGNPVVLTTPSNERGEVSHRLPHVLPGGAAILFTVTRNRFPVWDQTQVYVHSRQTGVSKLLIDGGADARYVPSGHLLYARDGALLAASFDLQRLEVAGAPVGVVSNVMQAAYAPGQLADTGAAQLSVSRSGTLVYIAGGVFPPVEQSVLEVDRAGRGEPLPIAPFAFRTLRLSPDGERLALSTLGRDRGIWLYTFARGTLSKLAAAGRGVAPVWTVDSERITYAAGTRGPDNLHWIRADGGGASELLIASEHNLVPGAWTPDGRELFYYQIPSEVASRTPEAPSVWSQDVPRKSAPKAITGSLGNAGGVDVSPDGRWIAYHSAESGQMQIYVQAYPGPGPRHQVSTDGGGSPIWRADGRELFYARSTTTQPLAGEPADGDVRMMAIPVTIHPTFTFGTPKQLFAGRYGMNGPARGYDVSADGRRFLMVQSRARAPDVITQMNVVQHWIEELKRLVPN
jgi:serine/threonine-protein kinase